ncbi:MAG: hypothetical protein DRJ03_14450 [Chloroflexi bacterium]|nr:MAG: hypothetical protein DRJ03_14450 [Chloroflexota bacterium]
MAKDKNKNKPMDLLPAEDELLKSMGYRMIDKLDGEAIGNAIEALTGGEATYEIRFKMKDGTVRYVRGIGWEGAKAMLMVIRQYEQHKGMQIVPEFTISEWPDIKFVNDQVIAVLKVNISGGRIQWHVVGQEYLYDSKGRRDPLAVTKAVSKAERNAILSVIPKAIKKGLIDYLSRKYGVKVVETEAEILESEREPEPEPSLAELEEEFNKMINFWPTSMHETWGRNFEATPEIVVKSMKRAIAEFSRLIRERPNMKVFDTPYGFRYARLVEKAKEVDKAGYPCDPDHVPDELMDLYESETSWDAFISKEAVQRSLTLRQFDVLNKLFDKVLKKGENNGVRNEG